MGLKEDVDVVIDRFQISPDEEGWGEISGYAIVVRFLCDRPMRAEREVYDRVLDKVIPANRSLNKAAKKLARKMKKGNLIVLRSPLEVVTLSDFSNYQRGLQGMAACCARTFQIYAQPQVSHTRVRVRTPFR